MAVTVPFKRERDTDNDRRRRGAGAHRDSQPLLCVGLSLGAACVNAHMAQRALLTACGHVPVRFGTRAASSAGAEGTGGGEGAPTPSDTGGLGGGVTGPQTPTEMGEVVFSVSTENLQRKQGQTQLPGLGTKTGEETPGNKVTLCFECEGK